MSLDARPAPPVTRAGLVSLSVVSSTIAAALAIGVTLFRFHSLAPLAVSHAPLPIQLAEGILVGTIFGLAAVGMFFRTPAFAGGRETARRVLESAPLSRAGLGLMSVAAGTGEELLFRAALQPLTGLWLGSAVFTAVHYWVPLHGIARILYGAFVFTISMALGMLFLRGGLVAAISAHTTVDLIILWIARGRLGRP